MLMIADGLLRSRPVVAPQSSLFFSDWTVCSTVRADKRNTVPQNSPDSNGKIAGCVSVQVAPLNLILPFHYLDWATKDEQEEPTPRTHRHAQYFIGLCLTIIITALVRMTSPTV